MDDIEQLVEQAEQLVEKPMDSVAGDRVLLTEELSKTVAVKGLTSAVTAEHIKEIFGAYGTIIRVGVPRYKSSPVVDKMFVEYENHEQAATAMRCMHQGMIDNVTVTCELDLRGPKLPRKNQRKFEKSHRRDRSPESASRGSLRKPFEDGRSHGRSYHHHQGGREYELLDSYVPSRR